MLNINQIRSAIRAKFFMPTISIRVQAGLSGASHQSMLRINERCEENKVNHLIADTLTDSVLIKKLYPESTRHFSEKRQIDIEEVLFELTKPRGKRKTRTLLYLAYVAKDPSTAMSRTHFFRIVRQCLKGAKLSMRQLHAAGDVVFVDYAGTKVFYMEKGKKVWVKVFVAVLGASKKIFAWATIGEKTQNWLDGMTRMFDYYGGGHTYRFNGQRQSFGH